MNWINLTLDRGKWWALVNTAMNIKFWKILDQLSNWWFLKKDSAPRS
jgi:hypothetical protein